MCATYSAPQNVYTLLKFFYVFLSFNLSPPSAAYMRQSTQQALVQVKACRLFGAKPLPETMLTYCQLEP